MLQNAPPAHPADPLHTHIYAPFTVSHSLRIISHVTKKLLTKMSSLHHAPPRPPPRETGRRGRGRGPCAVPRRHATRDTREPRGARESRATAARTSARSLQPLSAVSLSLGTRAVARAPRLSRRARARRPSRAGRACVVRRGGLSMNVYALSLFLNTLRAARAPITGPGPTGTRPALATAWQLRVALGCRAPPTVPKTPPAPRRWCHLVSVRVS